MDSVANTANTATMIAAALVTGPAVRAIPGRTADLVSIPAPTAARIRETTNTW